MTLCCGGSVAGWSPSHGNLSTLTLFFSFYLLIFFETDMVEAAIISLLELRCGCGHTGLIPGHGISCT